jgi:acetamidase/formamidase
MGIGGLPEDFPHGHIRTFRLDRERWEAAFAPGITLQLAPFLGVMGVAPRPGERRPAAIPDYFGGNIDNKELREGATLFLPVSVPGALFSAGDAHAAQGDGEVNGTAIETALEAALLQFVVRKDMRWSGPGRNADPLDHHDFT